MRRFCDTSDIVLYFVPQVIYPIKTTSSECLFLKHRLIKTETSCGATVLSGVIIAEANKFCEVQILNSV